MNGALEGILTLLGAATFAMCFVLVSMPDRGNIGSSKADIVLGILIGILFSLGIAVWICLGDKKAEAEEKKEAAKETVKDD